jgi:hypothetical protein
LLRAGEPLIYAYYDGIDKIAHERGFGAYYEAELRSADDVVEQVRAQLIEGAAMLVTADTGRSMSGPNDVDLADDVSKLIRNLSGEGRFRWLHASRARRPTCWPPPSRLRRRRLGDEPPGVDRRWLVRPGRQPAGGSAIRRRSVDATRADQLRRLGRQRAVSAGLSTRVAHIC